MDGEDAKAQEPEGQGGQEGKEPLGADPSAGGAAGSAADRQAEFEAAMAEKDERISELEARIAEAAKTAEATEQLTREIGELKAQAESDRMDYELKLAGCRSVRAGKALLDEHGGDVAALKEAEPWLFAAQGGSPTGGKTGLEPKGAATSSDKDMKRWRRLAGLDEG